MRIHLLSIAVVACLSPLVVPAQEKAENPYKNAKVGDYIAYKSYSVLDREAAQEQRRASATVHKITVFTKDEKEVTLKVVGGYRELTKIELAKPYNSAPDGWIYGRFEKIGEGKEKIQLGKKTYECNWLSGKWVLRGGKETADVKVWYCTSVPLNGLVAQEVCFHGFSLGFVDVRVGRIRTEMTDFGSGK